MIERRVIALLAATVASATSLALAQAPDAKPRRESSSSKKVDPSLEAAKQHFHQAVALFNEGNYSVALAEFEAAHNTHPSAVFLYNIALTQKRLFRYVEAIETLRRYVAEEKKLAPERRVEVEQLTAEMRALLVDVALDVSPAGAMISIDGRSAGVAPLARVQLVGGAHVIEVSAEGHEGARRELTVVAGMPVSVKLALREIPKSGRVRVNASVVGASVSIDGKHVGMAPIELELPIGGHLLVVAAEGFQRYQGELAIVGGETRDVPITLDALVLEQKKPLYKQWWPWTIAALGAGGIAAGVAVPLSTRREEPIPGTLGPAFDIR